MEKVIHRADSRGVAEHGWLHSRHSFSFASYYNPERMGFGVLRVINDDIVEADGGFPTHSHDNMEIVSIPLAGTLRHHDSMGNTHVIKHGEVQIMSAGTSLSHSEYNNSNTELVNFLQIWVLPKKADITPRYGQLAYESSQLQNRFQLVISPEEDENTIWINQDAYFSLGNFAQQQTGKYTLNKPNNGIYVFVIEGEIEIADELLSVRDAIGLTGANEIVVKAATENKLLVIEVPMI